jgi:Nucleotidyl transferase AbiEii toxin, Type IV TA system
MRTGRDWRIGSKRLMESKGYAARREPSEHAGGKRIYRYASALGGAGTIEIDINCLFRGPLYGVDRMLSAPIGSYRATNVPVLDIHEIVAGKMVALVTRRAARDLFDAHRIIAMPDLDWTKIKAATLMIGASAESFDWRTASPDAIGCEVGDITGKLAMCLHDRYFDPFGGPAGWIETVTAECRGVFSDGIQIQQLQNRYLYQLRTIPRDNGVGVSDHRKRKVRRVCWIELPDGIIRPFSIVFECSQNVSRAYRLSSAPRARPTVP